MKTALALIAIAITGCAPLTQEQWEQRNRAIDGMLAAQAQAKANQPAPYMIPMRGPAVAPSPGGVTGFLRSQSTNGNLKYCQYSNGVVVTYAAYEVCPLQTQ